MVLVDTVPVQVMGSPDGDPFMVMAPVELTVPVKFHSDTAIEQPVCVTVAREPIISLSQWFVIVQVPEMSGQLPPVPVGSSVPHPLPVVRLPEI